MPHISKYRLETKIQQNIEDRVFSLLQNSGPKTRRYVFREIFTPTERLMVAKRLALLFLISKNVPTHVISKHLKLSPSTVARFENAILCGKYKKSYSWVQIEKMSRGMLDLLKNLLAVPFNTYHKSLNQILDDL